MTGLKNLFASKTILTALAGAVFTLLSVFGVIEIDEDTRGFIVSALFALAGFFRFTATEELTVSTNKV